MSRLLAVDTATQACSAAMAWDGEYRETLQLGRNRHAELLVPMVQALLTEHQCHLDQLDALAFGSGPGSFTGLRIGIAVAQGLAFGAGLPVVPVSSLWALAARAGAPRVLAGIDARMNQLYWNVYRRRADGGMEALGTPRVSDPEHVCLPDADPDQEPDGGIWLAAGSGCEVYRDRLAPGVAGRIDFINGVHPHAVDIARIATGIFESGGAVAPEHAAPEYVRNDIVQGRSKPISD